VIKFFRESIYH